MTATTTTATFGCSLMVPAPWRTPGAVFSPTQGKHFAPCGVEAVSFATGDGVPSFRCQAHHDAHLTTSFAAFLAFSPIDRFPGYVAPSATV
jgi:hypothetical protein